MNKCIKVGDRLPIACFGEIQDGCLTNVSSESLFAGKTAVVFGLPGAYTPVCHSKHIRDYVEAAPRFRAKGLGFIVCISSNDPWVLERWARDVDPDRYIRFLSDGNLEFLRRTGLSTNHPDLYLGECSKRYSMILNNAVVDRIHIETSVLDYKCTKSERILV